MHIKIITVGKLKEKWQKAAIAEYTKRLRTYAKVTVVEVVDEKVPETLSDKQKEAVKQKEAERILTHLQKETYLITLEIDGKQFSSEDLAKKIESLSTYGKSNITFIIGGSLGLSSSITKKSNLALSFSKMTFPHQLMRMILLEQIYRAFRINRGEPYHK